MFAQSRVLRLEGKLVRARSQQLRIELDEILAVVHANNRQPSPRTVAFAEHALLEARGAKSTLRGDAGLRQFSQGMIDTVEEERKRIARELHDDLNQQVAWLNLKISTLGDDFEASPDVWRAERQMIADGLRKLSERLSRISRDLHPSILTDLGLVAAIRSYIGRFAEHENITAAFQTKKVPQNLPARVTICLYRILQEALRNVARHAHARRVHVELTLVSGELIRLVVRDFGDGLPKQRKGVGGLGLISMEERAKLVDGTFTLRSQPGRGTRITVEVPIPIEVPGR